MDEKFRLSNLLLRETIRLPISVEHCLVRSNKVMSSVVFFNDGEKQTMSYDSISWLIDVVGVGVAIFFFFFVLQVQLLHLHVITFNSEHTAHEHLKDVTFDSENTALHLNDVNSEHTAHEHLNDVTFKKEHTEHDRPLLESWVFTTMTVVRCDVGGDGWWRYW